MENKIKIILRSQKYGLTFKVKGTDHRFVFRDDVLVETDEDKLVANRTGIYFTIIPDHWVILSSEINVMYDVVNRMTDQEFLELKANVTLNQLKRDKSKSFKASK